MARRGPKPKKAKSMTDKIAAVLGDLEHCAEDAENLVKDSDILPAPVLASEIGKIRDKWMERMPLFDGDGVLMHKLRESYERVVVLIMDSLEKALTRLNARIEAGDTGDPNSKWTLSNDIRVIETLASQVQNFRTAAKATPPPSPKTLPETEDELDRRIAEAEAEKVRRAKLVTEDGQA